MRSDVALSEGVRHTIGARVDARRRPGGGSVASYGPNLVPVGAWTIAGTGVVDNGDGSLTMAGASNAATAAKTITLEDNTTYLVEFDLAWTSGGVKTQTYGATLAHAGASTARSASGHYSEEITTAAAGSFTNLFRFQTTGTSGTNSYTISGASLKKKLT